MNPNTIIKLNDIPKKIKKLNLIFFNIDGILDLKSFKKIKELICSNNKITFLDNLPSDLIKLDCSNNQLVNLDNLSSDLTELICYYNKLVNLDNLPTQLIKLNCSYNQLI